MENDLQDRWIVALTFPLPLWERVAPHGVRRRVRGLSPRIETPHPARTASTPPSPTGGEGRNVTPPLPSPLAPEAPRASIASGNPSSSRQNARGYRPRRR